MDEYGNCDKDWKVKDNRKKNNLKLEESTLFGFNDNHIVLIANNLFHVHVQTISV